VAKTREQNGDISRIPTQMLEYSSVGADTGRLMVRGTEGGGGGRRKKMARELHDSETNN
jgi:hypothetical protein